jgi:hypothetical protein
MAAAADREGDPDRCPGAAARYDLPVTDDPLELLRAQSGLAVDAEGRFLHRGEPIEHARTLSVLWGSLARRADGVFEVRIGPERAHVQVDETPWVVRGLGAPEGPGGPPVLLLADGSREPLAPATLRLGADGVVRCVARGGQPARFARAAQAALAPWLDEDPAGSGHFAITVGGCRFPIARAERP